MNSGQTVESRNYGVYVVLEKCGEENFVQLFHQSYIKKETGYPRTEFLAFAIKLLKEQQFYDDLLKLKPETQAVKDDEYDLHRQRQINWNSLVRVIQSERVKLEIGIFTFACMLKECAFHPDNPNQDETCPLDGNLFHIKLQNPCAFVCAKNSLGIDVQRHLIPIHQEKEHGWLPRDIPTASKISKLN